MEYLFNFPVKYKDKYDIINRLFYDEIDIDKYTSYILEVLNVVALPKELILMIYQYISDWLDKLIEYENLITLQSYTNTKLLTSIQTGKEDYLYLIHKYNITDHYYCQIIIKYNIVEFKGKKN